MAGSVFAPEQPRLFDSFAEILSESPSYSLIVINAPIGYYDGTEPISRTCDKEARKLLKKRGSTIHTAPMRDVLVNDSTNVVHLDAVSSRLLPRYREVASQMSPYRQRIIYEGHPELSFFQLNENTPMRFSKNTDDGNLERRMLLEKKIPDALKIIDAQLGKTPQKHLIDAAALLWSARRTHGHASIRIPADAEWDSEGLRIEMVY